MNADKMQCHGATEDSGGFRQDGSNGSVGSLVNVSVSYDKRGHGDDKK